MMSLPALVALGLGVVVITAAALKGFASFSSGGRRSGPSNNWQNEGYMAGQDGPSAERRPNASTAPSDYSGGFGGGVQ